MTAITTPAESPRYTFRGGAFTGTSRCRLEADHLRIDNDDRAGVRRVPYDDVRTVKLMPSQYTHLCIITTSRGNVVIPSGSYERLGVFRDQGRDYVRFLEVLHARLASRPKPPEFLNGSPVLYALCVVLALGGVVLSALLAYALFAPRVHVSTLPALGGVVLAIPLALKVLRLGKPGRYEPGRLHDLVVPALPAWERPAPTSR